MSRNAVWWVLGGAGVVGFGWWFLRRRHNDAANAAAAAAAERERLAAQEARLTGGVLNADAISDADRIAAAETLADAHHNIPPGGPPGGMPSPPPRPPRVVVPLSSGGIRIPLLGPSLSPLIRAGNPLSGWR